MKNFILNIICGTAVVVGLLTIVGAAGGLDKDMISMSQFFMFEALGFASWGIAYITNKFIED